MKPLIGECECPVCVQDGLQRGKCGYNFCKNAKKASMIGKCGQRVCTTVRRPRSRIGVCGCAVCGNAERQYPAKRQKEVEKV